MISRISVVLFLFVALSVGTWWSAIDALIEPDIPDGYIYINRIHGGKYLVAAMNGSIYVMPSNFITTHNAWNISLLMGAVVMQGLLIVWLFFEIKPKPANLTAPTTTKSSGST